MRTKSWAKCKGLSATTVRDIHQILSSALKLVQEQRIILTNPAECCVSPKIEHREMKALPVEQLPPFLREAMENGVFELCYLELATGLRRGELLSIKWEDIDLERDNLRVRSQISLINGEVVEAPLKTKNVYRALPLAEDAVSVLKEQKKKVGNSPWVFPSPKGGPISPDSVLHMLHRVLKRTGLPRVRFQDLRHTFAALVQKNVVDIKTVPVCWTTSLLASPWAPTLAHVTGPPSTRRPRRWGMSSPAVFEPLQSAPDPSAEISRMGVKQESQK